MEVTFVMRKIAAAVAMLGVAGTASAARWQVEIVNVTPGQSFTPILTAVHYGDSGIFALGQPASTALAALAEGGDTGPLSGTIAHATSVETLDGLLGPGQKRTVVVDGRPGERLTLAAMLVPTNDTFFSVNSVFLPLYGEETVTALAYDAGSEANDQNCAHMPGPRCGGEGVSPVPTDADEGFVYVSNGFHDLGEADAAGNEILKPAHYTWNDPVAIVTIRRIHSAW
jgi:hypothetical protein